MYFGTHRNTYIDADIEARHVAREAQSEITLLQGEVERLLMITEAMWMLLKERHGYQDSDLAKLVTLIDQRDGRLDGRVSKTPPKPCPGCGRPHARQRPVCMYCGYQIMPELFAR